MTSPASAPWQPPEWLVGKDRQERPTEILLPIVEGIGPIWWEQEKRGGWYAYLAVTVNTEPLDSSDGIVSECDHKHFDEASAWACAGDLGRDVATQVMEARRG